MAEHKQAEAAELRAAFSMWDLDGDGTISASELGKLLRACKLNPTEKDVRLLVKRFDADKNGSLDFDEFQALYKELLEKEPVNPRALLEESFKVFDMNGDGRIDRSELSFALTSLGEPLTEREAADLISQLDADGDGKIDYSEFVQLLIGG